MSSPLKVRDLSLLGALQPGTDEYEKRLRDQAAVALLPGLVEGYGEHATKNGWEYGWQEGVAQDAVILADALVAALYPEEVGDE